MVGTIHVVGAGLAGLAAAVRLARRAERLVLHEAAGQAGGRCRSYHDPALDMVIDNGNHLLLSGNDAALAYLRSIGADGLLAGPPLAEFPFIDMANGNRWTLRVNAERAPWWIFDAKRRAPGTTASDYLWFMRLLWTSRLKTVCETVQCEGALYRNLARPFLLAALNTDPKEASASLAGAVVRETLARGGRACRPLVARAGLGCVFIEPALRFLSERNVQIRFGHRLRALDFSNDKVVALDFAEDKVLLQAGDAVILTVPPVVAADLVPGITVPAQFRAIVNAHFRIEPPAAFAPITGVVSGIVEWLFAFPDRLSVTISAADRLLDLPREALAAKIWQEVAAISGLPKQLPPWQIVRERRATFAATPDENAKRPAADTAWRNLFLAGDWTRTGLPATIEGAIRSGHRAADLVCRT
jgi:squalene-associated FAD-dependent desaturase